MEKIYLGLGGNIGHVLPRLKKAIVLLSQHKDITQVLVSHYYQTAPHQMESPHRFVNAVCSFETGLSPLELFNLTQEVEKTLGKIPKEKNVDRLIDIDLLFYGEKYYRLKDLEIPHPRWRERLFVLKPLSDLTPEIILHSERGIERVVLNALIQPLIAQSSQTISLLT